jgi:hypothetical protein
LDPLWPRGSGFVEINGERETPGGFFADLAGNGDAFLQRHVANRDERDNVCGANSRMGAGMAIQVDQFCGLSNGTQCPFSDLFFFPYKRDDGTMMVSIHLNVHDEESRDRLDRNYDLIEDRPIAAFTEIGHTFDDVFHPEIHSSTNRRDTETQREAGKTNALVPLLFREGERCLQATQHLETSSH